MGRKCRYSGYMRSTRICGRKCSGDCSLRTLSFRLPFLLDPLTWSSLSKDASFWRRRVGLGCHARTSSAAKYVSTTVPVPRGVRGTGFAFFINTSARSPLATMDVPKTAVPIESIYRRSCRIHTKSERRTGRNGTFCDMRDFRIRCAVSDMLLSDYGGVGVRGGALPVFAPSLS